MARGEQIVEYSPRLRSWMDVRPSCSCTRPQGRRRGLWHRLGDSGL